MPAKAHPSTRILKQWYATHLAWPYPTPQDKEFLSACTGLGIGQVSQWFVNARRRGGHNASEIDPGLGSGEVLPVPIVSASLPMSLPTHAETGSTAWAAMTPIDRWRHSPPEDEPAPLEAITSAIWASPHGGSAASMPNPGRLPFDTTPSRPSSVNSFELSSSSATSSGSSSNSWSSAFGSGQWSDHGDGLDALPLRRRSKRRGQKRRQRHVTVAKPSTKKESPRIYQCTFCTDTFASRYDWTRHEGTLHLPLERWTCLPIGPRYIKPGENTARCALCDAAEPSDDHISIHNAAACTIKPLNLRAYHRKDHLRQHLRLVHHVPDLIPSMDSWKSGVVRIKSRCGFCGETFTKWSDRNDHLTDHFREGALMKEWKGCRGFEPAIALLVENAIPPYLIGAEATDPDPFSALRPGSKSFCQANATQLSPRTTFEELTARLGEYVQTTVNSGTPVTDDLLRKEARVILYSDDDPWNQTPADNTQWLNMFKIGYGLTAAADIPSAMPSEIVDAGPLHQYGVGSETVIASTLPVGMAPFTFENMQHAAGDSAMFLPPRCSINTEEGEDAAAQGVHIPWSWQTPECLAEFRQMGCASILATEYSQTTSELVPPGAFDPTTSAQPACLFPSLNFTMPASGRELPDTFTEPYGLCYPG